MNYKSIADLTLDINSWILKLPRDFDLIVGIPRSGLIVALILSEKLNIPVTDVDGLCAKTQFKAGCRISGINPEDLHTRKLRVLVVDDTIGAGTQLGIVQRQIGEAELPHKIEYGAVYTTRESDRLVNYSFAILNQPRIFEWNILGHTMLPQCQFDLDGVICCDPSEQENDDGPLYAKFLREAKPLFVPTREVDAIVTARLEKYRPQTTHWLNVHRVQFRRLVMLDLPDKSTRIKSARHGSYKGQVYGQSTAKLFIESDMAQASQIAQMTKRPVLCTSNWQLVGGDARHAFIPEQLERKRLMVERLWEHCKRVLAKIPGQ